MRIGIVGYGVVGHHMFTVFSPLHDICVYDKYIPSNNTHEHKLSINTCDLVFICVPTPMLASGACDLAAVEEVVAWVDRPMCIKSTVPPGTITNLIDVSSKRIVFSPEYVGETPFHASKSIRLPDLVAVGGEKELCELVVSAYRSVYGPEPHYFVTSAVTAELAKYMENCFFATKVGFVSQFYLLAEQYGADFTQMREIWVADTRVGRSHSTVIGGLGFGGKCLPKDLAAIIHDTKKRGAPALLLEAVQVFNRRVRDKVS